MNQEELRRKCIEQDIIDKAYGEAMKEASDKDFVKRIKLNNYTDTSDRIKRIEKKRQELLQAKDLKSTLKQEKKEQRLKLREIQKNIMSDFHTLKPSKEMMSKLGNCTGPQALATAKKLPHSRNLDAVFKQ